MSSAISITDGQFADEVLSSSQPVLVYFWAAWCGPCRLMAPSIDWAVKQYSDRLKIVKMEIDPNPKSVSTYSVEGVPALRLFHKGIVIDQSEGALNQQKLELFLQPHLSLAAS